MGRTEDDGRAITAPRLAQLLARLHADTEQAGHEYERLRRALVRFFDWRGALAPDECADETFDRLARRLAEDSQVEDVGQYAYGIARHVLLERRRQKVASSLEESPEPAAPPVPPDDDEPLRDCFDRCLGKMQEDGRSLVLEYYEGERSVKIANRRRIAKALGLTDNALRSRVQRLRDGLEACVRVCVSASDRRPS